MAKTAIIQDNQESHNFCIFLDGMEITDVHRYQIIREPNGPPLLRLEVYVLNGLEAQLQ